MFQGKNFDFKGPKESIAQHPERRFFILCDEFYHQDFSRIRGKREDRVNPVLRAQAGIAGL